MKFTYRFDCHAFCLTLCWKSASLKANCTKSRQKKLCSYLHCWITCALLTTLIFHFGSYCYNQCTVIVAPLEGWYGKSHWPFCTFWHKKMTRHNRPNVLVRRQCLMCTMFSSGHHSGVQKWMTGWGTCWKAGRKTEAESMKSHPSIYAPGFLFISSCKGGRRGWICFLWGLQ